MKLIGIFCTLLILAGCGEDEATSCQKRGRLIGRDLPKWACGGGWILETDAGDTINLYFANRFKEKLESWPDDALPINVSYTLKPLDAGNACSEFASDLACINFIEEP